MIYTISFIFGTLVGSFVHLAASRLPKDESFIFGGSRCFSCGAKLKVRSLIPIISFVIQGGKCGECSARISLSYPLVEAIAGILFLIPPIIFGTTWTDPSILFRIALGWFFLSGLFILFLTDLWYQMIPDVISLPLAASAFLFNSLTGAVTLNSLIFGIIIGVSWFGLQWLLSMGKWVGGGDLRLGLLAGALCGLTGILVVLFFAYVLGAIIALLLVAFKRVSFKGVFPLGTTLTLAMAIVYFIPAHVFISFIL